MKTPDQTRRDAVANLLATINDLMIHEGVPNNTSLAYSTVDAIAQHAIAVAAHRNTSPPVTHVDVDHGA